MSEEKPNGNGRITNADLRDALRDATESLRNEFNAHNTATGVQIGAVESTLRSELTNKIKTLRWQMVAALLGGQALAGLAAAIVTRTTPANAAHVAVAFATSLFN